MDTMGIYGGFQKIGGKNPKWMVYNGKPIKIDDLGVPLFLEIPILACAPSPVFLMTTRTINYMFRFGDPNLNFHVSRYGEGEKPN